MLGNVNFRTMILGGVVFITGFGAMGYAKGLDLNKKIFGRFNLGHIFGFVTAAAGAFILIDSWKVLRTVKETVEEIPIAGGLVTVTEDLVTA